MHGLKYVLVLVQILLTDDFIDKILADVSDISDVDEVSRLLWFLLIRKCDIYFGNDSIDMKTLED